MNQVIKLLQPLEDKGLIKQGEDTWLWKEGKFFYLQSKINIYHIKEHA